MKDNSLCVVKHNHVDDSSASEGHLVEVRGQGELIAEGLYAARQSELCPWKLIIVSLIWLRTTCLQKEGASGIRTSVSIQEKFVTFIKENNKHASLQIPPKLNQKAFLTLVKVQPGKK